MKQLTLSVMAQVGLLGCTSATASSYDSSNPIHCMTIFGVTSGTARSGPLADELNARIVHIVRSNGGADWLREIAPAGKQLAMSWEERARASQDGKEIMKLFDDCRSRQDADASFKAALPNLIQEGRTISAGAS
jgi:hypothetical protein